MALMGIREYGRHRGVSHVAVLKALRTGRIRQSPGGLIDAGQADRDWARNTHPAPRAPQLMPTSVTDDFGFSRARGVREHFEALLAKLEYEERSSELLDANEARIAEYKTSQIFRERMLQIPGAVVARLQAYVCEHGAEPDERSVYIILTEEIRAALTASADEMEGTAP